MSDVREVLRLRPGAAVDLAGHDPRATPAGPDSKSQAVAELAGLGEELDALQEALYAESRRRVLLVLQGMDTSGKGGVIRHVAGLVNPQGLHIASFKKPTEEERRHHFLWRVERQVPRPGLIGVFDRSHYEDVLVVRVDELAPEAQWRPRYAEITAFEDRLTADGVTILKCFLHISPQEQRERLLARLDDPAKHWKYNPGDLVVRARWSRYQLAYEEVLHRCGTEAAPWYVIPADRKWYRNWAVATLLRDTLRDLRPTPPRPGFDVDAERDRLLRHDPLG
ncbi:MAG TPA: PPK2 family polyphosphate kinase [Pseudonocardiaceae bacterium]